MGENRREVFRRADVYMFTPWHQRRELIIPLALAQGGQANDLPIIALGKGAKKHSKEERADLSNINGQPKVTFNPATGKGIEGETPGGWHQNHNRLPDKSRPLSVAADQGH